MSKRRTEFGEILREKWNAICQAVSNENEIWLDEYYLTSAFDCVYFLLRSVPKIPPQDILNTVKFEVTTILSNKYSKLRDELLRDTWHLTNPYDFTNMEYISYFMRFDTKFSEDILKKQVRNIDVGDIIIDAITNVIASYNERNDVNVGIGHFKIEPHSVEVIVSCPITMSASKMALIVKGASSHYIRENYPEFKNAESKVYISKGHFWSPGKFFAISKYPVKSIKPVESFIYESLMNRWEKAKNETDKNKKGPALERFASGMFESTKRFEILKDKNGKYDINLGFEQIDLTLINKSPKLVEWGPLIKVECKNYSESIGNDLIRDFSGKLRGDIRLGLLFSMKGFKKHDEKLLIRLLASPEKRLIVRITGSEIESWLKKIVHDIKKEYEHIESLDEILEHKILRAKLELI